MTPAQREIIARVAERNGLSIDELLLKRQHRSVSRPRQEAMWALRQAGRWSLPQIGRALGGFDHTTVLHGVRAHERRLAEDAESTLVQQDEKRCG